MVRPSVMKTFRTFPYIIFKRKLHEHLFDFFKYETLLFALGYYNHTSILRPRKSSAYLKHLHSALPALPEVTPGQKARHSVTSEVVDPALGSELRHDRVYERKASSGLRPCGQLFGVIVPRNLPAQRVALHAIEVGDAVTNGVEKLTPQQLTDKRHRWLRVLL